MSASVGLGPDPSVSRMPEAGGCRYSITERARGDLGVVGGDERGEEGTGGDKCGD